MLKKVVGILVALTVIMSTVSAFAIDDDQIIESVSSYTGNLFLSDWTDEGIILRDVKPVAGSTENIQIASELEYTEVSTFAGNIFSKNGDELDLYSLAWYLDVKVKVVAAKLADGSIRILSVITQ